jgi:hypothetical protein
MFSGLPVTIAGCLRKDAPMFDLFRLIVTGDYVPGMYPALGDEDSLLVDVALSFRSLFIA